MGVVKCGNRACTSNEDGYCEDLNLEVSWTGECQSCSGEYAEEVEDEG